jgi:hypothetical protein
MGSVSKLATAEAVVQVSTGEPLGHPRAKKVAATPLYPRLAPVRVEGRRIAAELLAQTLHDEDESMRRVARVLGLSKEMVQRFCDPDDRRQFPVGDLIALHFGGAQGIAYVYLDQLCRLIVGSLRGRRTAIENAVTLAKATGAAATALTESSDRATRVRSLHALRRHVDEAIGDVIAEGE